MAKSLSQPAKNQNDLTVHSWVPPSSKFMSKILLFKNPFLVKSQRIMQISRISPTVPMNYVNIRYKIHPH